MTKGGRLRVVVTGAAGRVGRAVVARLAGVADVVGLDLAPAQALAAPLPASLTACPGTRSPESASPDPARDGRGDRRADAAAHVVGDLADPQVLRPLLAGADAVIHAAALHAPHVGRVDDAQFVAVNVDATARLMAFAAGAGVRALVFTSTTALYGAGAAAPAAADWVDEATPPRPRTIYHRTKLQAEALLREAAEDGEPAPVVRILRMSRCFPEPLPDLVAYRLHRGIDVRDVAEAHALALAHALQQGAARCATWVVSATTPFEPGDCAALGRDAAAVIRARAPAVAALFAQRGWMLPSRIDRVYDARAARHALGWRPRFDALAAVRDGVGEPGQAMA